MGFNSAFKGLNLRIHVVHLTFLKKYDHDDSENWCSSWTPQNKFFLKLKRCICVSSSTSVQLQFWKIEGNLSIVRFLLDNSPASEFYMPTFRNKLFHLHRQVGKHLPTCLWRWNKQSVPKRRHIQSRRRGITQKKTYNISKLQYILEVTIFIQSSLS